MIDIGKLFAKASTTCLIFDVPAPAPSTAMQLPK
jgi:hypothetical protein